MERRREPGPVEPGPVDIETREAAWEQLRGRLDLHEGFWLGFVFGVTPRSVRELADRSGNYLRMTAHSVAVHNLTEPADLTAAPGWLLGLGAQVRLGLGLVWVTDLTGRSDEEWREVWRSLLLRLNERREAVRTTIPAGLVLTGPAWLLPLTRDLAPDLWSYRSTVYLASYLAAHRAGPPAAAPDPSRPQAAVPSGELAAFVDRALAPAVEPTPAVAPLLREAETELQAGRAHQVITLADRALAATTSASDQALALALIALGREAQEDTATAIDRAREALGLGEPLGRGRTDELLNLMAGGPDAARTEWALERQVAIARREAANSEQSAASLRTLSGALDRLADAHERRGDLDTALAEFTEALGIDRRLAERDNDTPDSLRDLTAALDRVGDIHQARGDLDTALAHYTESLDLSRHLRTTYGDTPDSLRDLTVALDRVGDIHQARGDLDTALEHLAEALELDRRICREFGETPLALRILAISLERFGLVLGKLGDVAGAGTALAEAVRCYERLTEEYGPPHSDDEVLARLRGRTAQ
ncbi:MAG TPA: tetratricopeptide repeat protein [Mycobacteriales bacterium]|nr:tetratricopeptide repeat protein [Mycobacteriales bacterium]